MAYTQSHQPGVIRCTRDYLQAPESVAPDSQAPESPATGSPAPGSPAPQSLEDLEYARVPSPISTLSGDDDSSTVSTTRENPREVRNRAEKMRRDRLNEAVAELASMVPPVVAARRKIDKTTVLRLTAHYLRAHQYVFGDSIGQPSQQFNSATILKVLGLFNGFLITTTYRGIIVVVSQNVNQYLGYTELDLLGQNLLNITHEGDRAMLLDQLMPRTQNLGVNGELMIPDEPDGARKVKETLAAEKRQFVIRLKKLGQRSEPTQYVTCHVEGSLRKSDRACRSNNRCCQIVRRARARTENPCSSGNDIVFIGMVRPTSESFINESALESYRMEYRTRHSIDGEIIQCESRIALVTGYMTQEVSGVNAMNFMHRDDVRWVIIALREMYDQHRLFGESCYRLITKSGQPIYMRTRGCLDVDHDSRAVTSFVCTNTVVTEEEGKILIKLMKRKFSLLVNNSETAAIEEIQDDTNYNEEQDEDQPAAVEDPRRLERVILHLVTNLPSPSSQDSEEEPSTSASPDRKSMSPHRLTIIPPNKERIVSAIEKIYGVMNTFQKDSKQEENNYEQSSQEGSSNNIPRYINPVETISMPSQKGQIVPFRSAHVSNYVDVSNSLDAQPMPYNISDNDYNSDSILNAVASPDMGYFDDSSSPFSNLSSIFSNFNQNCDEMLLEHQTAEVQEFDHDAKNHGVENHGAENHGADNHGAENHGAENHGAENHGAENYGADNHGAEGAGFDGAAYSGAEYDGAGSDSAEYHGADLDNAEYHGKQQEGAEYDRAGCHGAEYDAVRYHGAESAMIMPILHYADESNVFQAMPQASSSNISCGTKRPNDFEDFDMVYKKKITEFEYARQNDSTSDLDSPVGSLFDESDYTSEAVDLAVRSLEFTDSAFPNLLVATEVQDILSQIEKEAENERLRDFNLSDYE